MCFAQTGVIIIIQPFPNLESTDLKCVSAVLEDCLVFANRINDNASDTLNHTVVKGNWTEFLLHSKL